MKPIDRIKSYHADLTAQRRDFHAHPEIGFTEHRTSDAVAKQLEALGITGLFLGPIILAVIWELFRAWVREQSVV